MRYGILTTITPVLLAVSLFTGCSTPKHTNTLIFGTNTKVAIDISQDVAGSLGLTVGYKRQEAVWMPLLPNQADGSDKGALIPAPCPKDQSGSCEKYEGTTGGGGAAGSQARDTYSVLATLSGQTSASGGGGVEAKGGIAQVFATGFAARLLAVSGGAALVNSNVDPTSSAAVAAITKSTLKVEGDQIDEVMACVQLPNSSLDGNKLGALTDKAEAADTSKKIFTTSTVTKLKGYKKAPDLRAYLGDYGDRLVPLLHTHVKSVCP